MVPINEQPQGIDVYHGNGTLNWNTIKGAGVVFGYAKASEGDGFVDGSFSANRLGMRDNGIITGGYHFFTHDIDGVRQANHFIAVIGGYQKGDLPPAIDFERDPSTPVSWTMNNKHLITDHLRAMVNRLRAVLGVDPVIYTDPWDWIHLLGDPKGFDDCPLWIANWGVDRPKLCGSWTYHTFHQFTSTGRIMGVRGNLDRNRFNGKLTNLRKLAGGV